MVQRRGLFAFRPPDEEPPKCLVGGFTTSFCLVLPLSSQDGKALYLKSCTSNVEEGQFRHPLEYRGIRWKRKAVQDEINIDRALTLPPHAH